MNELALPEQLRGAWENALILTYGADLPFYENGLWSQLGACPNKIVLADGRQFLTHCIEWARSGAVRMLNQRYVAEPIGAPFAAHGKMILLTRPESGRLLVGSGNLGLSGYASGGELFVQYEYTSAEPGSLGAFQAAWELVRGMVDRGYITGAQTRYRLDHLLERTPWLLGTAQESRPVRHNLERSFLDQLTEAVAGRAVEELWILAPFFDCRAAALEQLLAALRPRRAMMLVQPRATSVDPVCLRAVLDGWGGKYEIRPVSRLGDDRTYLHAKLYLARLREAAVCLQGSPNLSQAAMLLTVPHGNIELANLLEGSRDAFDHLLAGLDIGAPVHDPATLDLALEPSTGLPEPLTQSWQLTGGEWKEDRLHLTFRGPAPELAAAALVIAGRAFPFELVQCSVGQLTLRVAPEVAVALGRAVPVTIRWPEGSGWLDTNPVFVCNQAALDWELRSEGGGRDAPDLGRLELEDAEVEQLVRDLDATLVIDNRSLWQLAGRRPPPAPSPDEDAPPLSYADVDYERLRQFPRLQQYFMAHRSGSYRPTRLQLLLSSIIRHFEDMLARPPSAGAPGTGAAPRGGPPSEAAGEETEEEAHERERRQRSMQQRIEGVLKAFIRRYLAGVRNPEFARAVGYEVMVYNYGIFTHLLWRLFGKDWLPSEFIVQALLDTWTFFWGSRDQRGYFWSLTNEEQALARGWLAEQHAAGQLLASVTWCASLTAGKAQEEVRFCLRDVWREFLQRPLFEATAGEMEVAWRSLSVLRPYMTPLPSEIVETLERLAAFETPDSFLRLMERLYDSRPYSWHFERTRVAREGSHQPVSVVCLVTPATRALGSHEDALKVLHRWMAWEERDYYRIASPAANNAQQLLFWDRAAGSGIYRSSRPQDPIVEFTQVPAAPNPDLASWRTAAEVLEERITMPVPPRAVHATPAAGHPQARDGALQSVG